MKKLYDLTVSRIFDFWSNGIADPKESDSLILKREFFPNEALSEFELRIDFSIEEFGEVIVTALPYLVWLNRNIQACICRNFAGNTVAQSLALNLQRNSINRLVVTFCSGCIEVNLNNTLLTFKSDYKPLITSLEITLPGKSTIHTLELSGEVIEKKLRPSANLNVATTIDFYDDMLPEPFTPEMLESAFRKISEMGIKRVYWVHHGEQESGFWSSLGNDVICDHVKETFSNLGGNILAKASKLAHTCGLELIAVIKPFDMSIMGRTFPVNSEMARKYGKNEIIGGKAYCCFDYVAQHPELCMQRRQKQNVNCQAIPSRIEINFNGTAIPDIDVRLWTSVDNGKYSIYMQEMTIIRRPGKIILSRIAIHDRYIAVELLGRSDFLYGNILKDMIRVYDASGDMVECTLGLKPRKITTYDEKTCHLAIGNKKSSFAEVGFDFDALRLCVPSGICCGNIFSSHYHQLSFANNVFGIAIGCNQYVPGAMCPSEPEARSYWLGLIKEALNSEVDGVDIRVSSHLDILEWEKFGFNAPVASAYQKRYGINILEHDFDKSLLRKLRGEFYTQFLKCVKDIVRTYKKKIQLHIEDVMEGSADNSTMMEIYWDWQKWIDVIVPDGITFKAINLNSHSASYAIEVVERCRERNIPVELCAFTHCIDDYEKLAKSLKKIGFSGINLYEFASYYKASNGDIVPINSRLISNIKSDLK